jgi:formylglycine-generating enzyme required for sulfatase activity
MKRVVVLFLVILAAIPILAECPSADLTGDCVVNVADFAVFASQWMTEGDPVLYDIVWMTVNDPGVSGHEGFNGQMSKYETTNAQYCLFLNSALATGDISVSGDYVYGAKGLNSGIDFVGKRYYYLPGTARINYIDGAFTVDRGYENHPVTYISWYGATAFSNYYGYRLPTVWEWQAVADYDGSYSYSCGKNINNRIANYYGSVHSEGTTEVGAFGAYGYGMCDMAGNVWEWTSSCYYSNCGDDIRVLCGGSWYDDFFYCNVSYRGNHIPNVMESNDGFRVCR